MLGVAGGPYGVAMEASRHRDLVTQVLSEFNGNGEPPTATLPAHGLHVESWPHPVRCFVCSAPPGGGAADVLLVGEVNRKFSLCQKCRDPGPTC